MQRYVINKYNFGLYLNRKLEILTNDKKAVAQRKQNFTEITKS